MTIQANPAVMPGTGASPSSNVPSGEGTQHQQVPSSIVKSAVASLRPQAEPEASSEPESGGVTDERVPTFEPESGFFEEEVELTTSLQMPKSLTPHEGFTTGAELAPWTLSLTSVNCFDCTGFNPMGNRDMNRQKCRPDRNPDCPHGEFVIEFVGARRWFESNLAAAQRDGDAVKIAHLISSISTSDRLTENDRNTILVNAGIIKA